MTVNSFFLNPFLALQVDTARATWAKLRHLFSSPSSPFLPILSPQTIFTLATHESSSTPFSYLSVLPKLTCWPLSPSLTPVFLGVNIGREATLPAYGARKTSIATRTLNLTFCNLSFPAWSWILGSFLWNVAVLKLTFLIQSRRKMWHHS